MKMLKAIVSATYRLGFITVFVVSTWSCSNIYAQAPTLPPANLGLANVYDGVAGPPGLVYQGYTQLFETKRINNGNGDNTGLPLKINSVLTLQQLIYMTPVKVLDGKLGFTALLPIVKISATSPSGPAPSLNPGAVGDLVGGVAVQWNDKKLFGKSFWHRVEVDANFPTGSYDPAYAINASSHLWAFSIYHTFTLFLNKNLTISARNQFNFNSNIIGTPDRPGAFYNGNYSAAFAVLKNLKVEAAAYYLMQFTEDSYNGDHSYFQNTYQFSSTKERIFGVGPGLAYFLPGGILFEGKVFFETVAKNTTQGTRSVLRIAIPF